MQDMFSPKPPERSVPPPVARQFVPKRKMSALRFFAWSLVVLVIIFVVMVVIPAVFSGATVKITPRHEVVGVDNDFTALKGNATSTLGFEIMKLDDSASVTVPASGTEKVEKKASGTITIFNEYSSVAQKLIAKTRFKSPDGLIYRIQEAVSVPGAKSSSKGLVPGTLDVVVYADAAGAEYNIKPADFTIPGFESSPKYTKIYAKSKASMVGGIVGLVKIADPKTIADAQTQLRAALTDKVRRQAVVQTPANYMLYTDDSFIKFADVSSNVADTASTSDQTFEVRGSATIYGILFSTHDLARAVATKLISNYNNEDVSISNVDKLKFTIDKTAVSSIDDLDKLSFHLKGQASIEWLFDESDLKQKLSGLRKSEYSQIFAEFPGISRAEVVMSPAWAVSFPRDPKKIIIAKITATE